MGLLSQIESTPEQQTGNVATPWRHVALRVLSYDRDNLVTTGVDITSGEELKIKLAGPRNERRDDVHVWAEERFKMKGKYLTLDKPKAVVAGDETEAGVIIFEAVRPSDQEGLMEARWATVASHSADEASVFPVLARPIPSRDNPAAPHPSLGIEMVRPVTAAKVLFREEIAEQITELVSRPFTKAVVRAMDEDGKVHSAVVARPFTPEVRALNDKQKGVEQALLKEGKSFGDARAKAAAQFSEERKLAEQNASNMAAPNFFKFDALGKLLERLDEDQMASLKLEVFGLEQVYPGSSYKKTLENVNSVDGIMLRRDWTIAGESGFGFTETFVALRQHEEGGLLLTKVRPSSTRPLLYAGLNDITTPNIQPAVTPVMSRAMLQQPQEEAAPPPESEPEPVARPAGARGSVEDGCEAQTLEKVDELSVSLAGAARVYQQRR